MSRASRLVTRRVRNRRIAVALTVSVGLLFGGSFAYAASSGSASQADADLAQAQALIGNARSYLQGLSTTTTTGSTVPPSTTTTVPQGTPGPLGVPGTWHATFADEFNNLSVDRTKWVGAGNWECCNGGRSNPGNGELDYKSDNNCAEGFGALVITAKRETAPNGQAWTSCQIASTQDFLYGYTETRALFASPKGFLNALWTWGRNNSSQGETDGYEFYSDNHTQAAYTSHLPGGGGCGFRQLGFDPTNGFHVYGVDVEASGTDWYVDGVHICHAAGAPVAPWFLIDYMTVNAASRAPVADPSTTTASYTVDYIRAFSH